MFKIKSVLLLIALIAIITFLVFLFAQYQITIIFSVAAVGYPQNLIYVVLNFILISFFIVFIGFRKKLARLPASVYVAFVVALYIEMYGFPLTMYFFTWALGSSSVSTLWYFLTIITGEKLFYALFMGIIVPISNVIIISGILLVIFGWSKIFRAKNQLVKTGIYNHVRHPQYLGFLMITLGMNVLWVTLSTLALWPVLVFLYYRLANEEDKQMQEKFGKEFDEYKENVPMFIPKLKNLKKEI